MPLWDFHTSKKVLTSDEKQHLATEINKLYVAAGLPAFYVNVRFTEHDAENHFNGGKPHDNLCIIRIEHLARQFKDFDEKRRFLTRADTILNPVLKGKGILWEYAVTVMDRDLWEINGLVPPMPGTEMEKKWAELNEPVEDDVKN